MPRIGGLYPITFNPADQVEAENKRLNKARETLKKRQLELEKQLKADRDIATSIPKIERFIERIQGNIAAVDFEGKRLALDMLGITVWLDGENIEITGTVDPGIVLIPSSAGYSLL